MLGGQEVLFFVQASNSLLLMHCRLLCYFAEKSILFLVQEINHLASSHNLLLLSTMEKLLFKFS